MAVATVRLRSAERGGGDSLSFLRAPCVTRPTSYSRWYRHLRRWSLLCAASYLLTSNSSLGSDHSEYRSDLYGFPFLNVDRQQLAARWRWDLGIDLVCRYLEERLVFGYVVADLFQPFRDGALGYGFAHLG